MMPQDFGVESPLYVAIRATQSIAIVVLLGVLALRMVVLPRYLRQAAADEDVLASTERTARWWVAGALLAFGLATIARLGAQHAAIFGATEDWSRNTIGALILQSRWGLAWCLAAVGAAVGVWALTRAARAWPLLAVATMVMVVAISMSGHAAAATSPFTATTVHALHVIGAGGWMGSLAAMLGIAIPLTLAQPGPRRHEVIAGLLNAFSPTALAFAGLVAITGVIAAWRNLVTWEALWQSRYGLVLMAKLTMLSVAAITGGYNWKRVLPTLGTPTGTARLRISAGVELVAALAILVITAVLVATPMPAEMTMISAGR
jgi:putative copper export protein